MAIVSRHVVMLPEHAAQVAWHPTSERVAVACADGTVGVIELTSGPRLEALSQHPGGALAVAISPDGTTVASGGEDGTIRLIEAGAPERAMGSGPAVHSLAWSPTGRHLAAAAGRRLSFWRRDGSPAGEHQDRSTSVATLAWDEAGGLITAVSAEAIDLLKPGRRKAVATIPTTFAGPTLAAAESPGGAFLALGHYDGTASVLQMDSGKSIQYGGLGGKVRCLTWTPDASALLIAADHRVAAFRFTRRAPATDRARLLKRHRDRVRALGIVGARYMLSGDRAGILHGWDLGREFRHAFEVPTGAPIEAIEGSPDGKRAAIVGRGGLLTIVSLEHPHPRRAR